MSGWWQSLGVDAAALVAAGSLTLSGFIAWTDSRARDRANAAARAEREQIAREAREERAAELARQDAKRWLADRRISYARFLGAAVTARERSVWWLRDIYSESATRTPDTLADAAYREALGDIELIGPKAVREVCGELSELLARADVVRFRVAHDLRTNRDGHAAEAREDEFVGMPNRIDELVRKVRAAMRADLGTDDASDQRPEISQPPS